MLKRLEDLNWRTQSGSLNHGHDGVADNPDSKPRKS